MAKAKNSRSDTQQSGSWKAFGAFFRHAKLSWGWIILSLVINIAYYSVLAYLPGSTAALLGGNLTGEAFWAAIINYSSLCILQAIVTLTMLIAASKSVRSVRSAVWKRMMGIEGKYYDEHSASHLLSTVTSDTENTVSALLNTVVTIPGLITYLLSAIPLLNEYNPKLMAVVFILIPIYIAYSVFMGRWQCKVGFQIQMKIGGLTGFLTERIRNLTLIKSFVTEEQEEKKGVQAAKELSKANVEYSYVTGIAVGYTFLTEAIGVVIAVIWGCMLLRNKEIDLTAWLAFFLFVPTINTVLRQLSNTWSNLKDVQGRAARLGAMMEAPQENMNEQASTEIPKADVVLENVSFGYRADTPILKNVSFSIPQGKTTAIVGPSGSGKTTILRLLEKLYTAQDGSITVGGQNLNDMNLAAWRDQMSYVNQDAEIFSGTIREALTYGITRNVDDAQLEQVTRLADIYDFIAAKPEGFDAELAVWGSSMSGGQRQRMVIARELLKNANILLLDEPTSALDTETATAISNTFFKDFAGKTIVTVTHELNFICHADQIVVLKQGEVEAIGTHEELIVSSKTYRDLVEEHSYQEVFE